MQKATNRPPQPLAAPRTGLPASCTWPLFSSDDFEAVIYVIILDIYLMPRGASVNAPTTFPGTLSSFLKGETEAQSDDIPHPRDPAACERQPNHTPASWRLGLGGRKGPDSGLWEGHRL